MAKMELTLEASSATPEDLFHLLSCLLVGRQNPRVLVTHSHGPIETGVLTECRFGEEFILTTAALTTQPVGGEMVVHKLGPTREYSCKIREMLITRTADGISVQSYDPSDPDATGEGADDRFILTLVDDPTAVIDLEFVRIVGRVVEELNKLRHRSPGDITDTVVIGDDARNLLTILADHYGVDLDYFPEQDAGLTVWDVALRVFEDINRPTPQPPTEEVAEEGRS